MTLDQPTVEAALAKVNQPRRADQQVKLERFDGARFTLSFPNRAMPEGQCIDQDFTEIQWALHEDRQIVTSIVGGRLDEADDRYHIEYELVVWD